MRSFLLLFNLPEISPVVPLKKFTSHLNSLSNSWPDDTPDNELLAAILEISSDAIWVNNYQKGSTYWLSSVVNQLKYGLPGRNGDADFWVTNIHPDDALQVVTGYEAALVNPEMRTYDHEYRFKGKDQYFVIRDAMRFFRDETGKATLVVGIWTDVTEVRFREAKIESLLDKLEQERNQFQIISSLTNSAMWKVDLGTNQIHWTAGRETLNKFGLGKSPYTLDDWKETVHPDDRARVLRHFDEIIDSWESVYSDQYRIILPDGKVAHMIDQGYILRDHEGKPVQMLGGWIDMTREREQEEDLRYALDRQEKLNEEISAHEEELASSEEELRQINEQLYLNVQALTEREFIISQSQKLAKIGSWDYQVGEERMVWSNEMYSICGVDTAFHVNNLREILRLFDEKSRPLIAEAFESMVNRKKLLFDITAQIITPIGYRKWLRITAYPIISHDKGFRITGLAYDITYFKEAEERLRTSEDKFARAFRNNPDMMTIVREDDLIVLDVNDKVQQVLGYTREEVLGIKSTDLNLFVSQEERTRFYEKYNAHGQVQMEAVWRKKNGSSFQALISSSRLELEGKKCLISVVRDISDRKIAEEKFQKAFDLSPDLMLIFRESDRVLVEANSKLTDLAGYTREEAIGQTSRDYDLWYDPEEQRRFLEVYTQKGYNVTEAQLYKKGKVSYFGTVTAQRILLNNENHMLVVVRDTTEQRLAKERLLQSEANLSATINNTTFLIWSIDRDFKLLNFNNPFADYMKEKYGVDGLKVGELIFGARENPLLDLRESWTERYKRALSGQTVKVSEVRDGKYFDISLNPIIDKGKVMGASIFAEDVTDRVEKENELSEALRKIGELKLTALRSVMNPHFIFNALNSIQFFIAQNDRKNAISYLSTFSKLVRGILTHSLNNKIKLSEELDQLKNYVALEQMRFENEFDFLLHIDDSVDVDSIEIPSMLIQPYVENAILHGLYNKQGGRGVLEIRVSEVQTSLLFEIIDNGIGRKAAMDLRALNFPKHKSMGTALTEERLKLINAKEKVAFEVIDLFDDKLQKPCGTKVKIWVKE